MWSSRRIAATVGSQRLAHPTTAVAGTAFASWSDAVAALSTASDNVPAHCAALRSIREQPRDVATRVVQHCLTLQRYSDACASAAFPLLCDALAVLPEAGKPDDAANVIRLSMQRGAYVDSAGFGPLLRLYNQRLGVKAYPEVSRLWTWIQHTRAAHCSVARSAVVAATARDGQHGAAMRLEAALRVDGILLREEGLVSLLESLPIGEWQTAASLVRHWASEHKAASMHNVQKHGDMAPPSLATAMALVRVCAAAGKGSVARSALAHWLEDADLLMAMTPADFRDAFDAVLPACGPSSSTTAKPGEAGHPAEGATSSTAAAATSSADLLRRLLLGSSVAVAAVEQPFSRLSDDKQALIAELLGYMAAAAALLRSRDDLLSVGDHIVRLGFGSSMFHVVTTALVKSLSPKAWREGKLAAVELSRKTKMEIPLSIQARLHVLHQSVAEDHEAVLDAALGR